MPKDLKKTALYAWHKTHGGQMVEFAGWEMSVAYQRGILEEHLTTRRYGGLFDISHMGRFLIRGKDAIPFMQYVLTNNAMALDPGMAHYTLVQNERGGALDDAYLYRLEEIVLEDYSKLPDPWRNRLRVCALEGEHVYITISRTGYTGEPISFELFLPADRTVQIWEKILELGEKEGVIPAGLGARATLRLEAGLPLYGHELGQDPEGKDMPLFTFPFARIGVSFSPAKGEFTGRKALARQFEALGRIMKREYSMRAVLPRIIQPVAVAGRGVARAGAGVLKEGKSVGFVTSGTMVPYWVIEGEGLRSVRTDQRQLRSICLACMDWGGLGGGRGRVE